MALKKNPESAPATPAFEVDDSDTTVLDAPEQAQEPVATPQAKAQATTAIAKASASAVAAPKKGFNFTLQEYENNLDIEYVKALGVGTLPKVSADRAGFEQGEGKDKKEFGDWIDFEIYSFNKRWLVTAGVDGDEGKDLLRTSYDGATLEDESMTAQEYLEYLKGEGYAKAKLRMYIDVWGFVVNSAKGGEVAEADREMIQLQLSPTSVKQFTAYQLQAGVKAARFKQEPSNVVRATIDRREFDGNKFAAIKFSAA